MPDLIVGIAVIVLIVVFGTALNDRMWIRAAMSLSLAIVMILWIVLAYATSSYASINVREVHEVKEENHGVTKQFVVFDGKIYDLNNYFRGSVSSGTVEVCVCNTFNIGMFMVFMTDDKIKTKIRMNGTEYSKIAR